jgi:hypothetical protein
MPTLRKKITLGCFHPNQLKSRDQEGNYVWEIRNDY